MMKGKKKAGPARVARAEKKNLFSRFFLLRLVFYPPVILFSVSLAGTLTALFPPRTSSEINPGHYDLSWREVTFSAPGGPLLSGWLVKNEHARANIICLHGYPADKGDILSSVLFLLPDFNLFLFDFRGMGESAGRMTTLGWRETDDVIAAAEFISRQPGIGDLPLGAWGYSMGGSTALMAAARADIFQAIVTDSAFADLSAMVETYYAPLGPLSRPVAFFSRGIYRLLAGASIDRVSPARASGQVKAPVLMIHNRNDPVVPFDQGLLTRETGRDSRKLLVIDSGSIHGAVPDPAIREEIREFFREKLSLPGRERVKKD